MLLEANHEPQADHLDPCGPMLTQGSADEAITGSKDQQDKEEKILDAFKAWDKDANGYITKDGLLDSTLSAAKGNCPAMKIQTG
eukprot:Skav203596  [mRNA]  locus=scaffold935:257224:257475:+ [translate_table: standard]